MTEQQWAECDSPDRMLAIVRGGASDRKLRLFDCACCRRLWHLLTDPRSRAAVEVAERFVDDGADAAELSDAYERATAAVPELPQPASRRAFLVTRAAEVAAGTAYPAPYGEGGDNFGVAVAFIDFAAGAGEDAESGPAAEVRAEADLARDIFGNPFRLSRIEPEWLAWNAGAVAKLARTIYEERRFFDLPILADVLEGAGCADRQLLDHCRVQGPHVRGCWVVDLILGKEDLNRVVE